MEKESGDSTDYTSNSYVTLWTKFLETYQKKDQGRILEGQRYPTQFPGYYHNVIYGMRDHNAHFILDYKDFDEYVLKNPKDHNALDALLHEDIRSGMSSLREAIIMLISGFDDEYAKSPEVELMLHPGVINWPMHKEMRSIGAEDIGHALQIEGFVTMVEVKKPYYKTIVFRCLKNGCINEIETSSFRVETPKRCLICNSYGVEEDADHSKLRDVQLVRLQERQEKTQAGNIPDSKMVVILNPHFIDKLKPGDFASISVIVHMEKSSGKSKNMIGDIYFEAVGLESKSDYSLFDESLGLEEVVKDFVKPETEDADFEKLVASVAPSVFGHNAMKRALLLQIAGADFQVMLDQRRMRGDLQIALFGSPSTGKTALAEYVNQIYPRSIYVSGQVTDVGFTASISYNDGIAQLEAGVYLLTSGDMGGLVVCDELEKTDKKARWALAQAMDDRQQISIQKHNIHKSIQVKTASLHLANPIGDAIWDSTKSIYDNTKFEHWLLSRYDLVFVLRDDYDKELDAKVAKHFLKQLGMAISEEEIKQQTKGGEYHRLTDMLKTRADAANMLATDAEKFHSVAEMKAWQRHIRTKYHPKFRYDSEAATVVLEHWLKLRGTAGNAIRNLKVEDPTGNTKALANPWTSTTVRQLGGMIRLACASARAHHRNVVTEKDARIAIELVEISIMSSGYDPISHKQLDITSPINAGNKQMTMFDTTRNADANQKMLVGREKFANSVRKRFLRVVRDVAFEDCPDCGAGGTIRGKRCGLCDGNGMFPSYLSKSIVINEGKKEGVPFDDIMLMWQDCIKNKYIKGSPSDEMFTITADGIRFFLDKVGHKFLPVSGNTGFTKEQIVAFKQVSKAEKILDSLSSPNVTMPAEEEVVEEVETETTEDVMNDDEWEDVPPGEESDDDVVVEEETGEDTGEK